MTPEKITTKMKVMIVILLYTYNVSERGFGSLCLCSMQSMNIRLVLLMPF